MKALYSLANVQDSGMQRPKLSSLSGRGNQNASSEGRPLPPLHFHTEPGPRAGCHQPNLIQQAKTMPDRLPNPHNPLYSLRAGCMGPERGPCCLRVYLWTLMLICVRLRAGGQLQARQGMIISLTGISSSFVCVCGILCACFWARRLTLVNTEGLE